MKLTLFASALLAVVLSLPAALAEDSSYLEEKTKRLHDKPQTTTPGPAPASSLLPPGWWH